MLQQYFTAEKVIENLKPDFYCKGNDYSKDQMKFDKNLIKEIKALKINKGKFKIINEENFSSSQFINENNFQNFDQECRSYVNLIRKKFNLNQIIKNLKIIKNKIIKYLEDRKALEIRIKDLESQNIIEVKKKTIILKKNLSLAINIILFIKKFFNLKSEG